MEFDTMEKKGKNVQCEGVGLPHGENRPFQIH